MVTDHLAAVLFDMDGTLVDSEKVWTVGLQELAEHYGGELSARARAAMVGGGADDTMAILHEDLDQPWRDPAYGAAWLDARVAELFADGLDWLPGAQELIAAVRAAGLRSALVTNTGRALADIALRTIGADNFDVVVCGDEVARVKPDPLPYVTAAKFLGLSPQECVVIEDSPAGVRSAFGAGCVVVAVPNELALEGTAEASLVVASLLELDVDRLRGLFLG